MANVFQRHCVEIVRISLNKASKIASKLLELHGCYGCMREDERLGKAHEAQVVRTHYDLEFLFHPRSIALAGISVSDPEHWTRTFFDSLLEFQFEGPIYPVNPKGGEIGGLKVYPSVEDIPDTVDYAISTVSNRVAPKLVAECARKGVKAIHFCTAGFSETGDGEGARLELELGRVSRDMGIRIIGPNCMGIYCPESRLSFDVDFPKESGPVGVLSQSGGNALAIVKQAICRGVRFSKVISYGNACDLSESDLLEYLTADPNTKIIALYIEGVRDGKRFLRALNEAAREKVVILLKGGVTEGGARGAAGHTGSLAGSEVTWDSLCKQLGVIRVHSLEEWADALVMFSFMRPPRGRNVALVGAGGGASVLIADEFEKRGLKVPELPEEIRSRIGEFTQAAGNILRNPIDYSQTVLETEKLVKTIGIISEWEGIDCVIGFLMAFSRQSLRAGGLLDRATEGILEASKAVSKPMAMMFEPRILPEEVNQVFPLMDKFVSSGLPLYYSFASAANALNLYLSYEETRARKPRR